jgi:poly-gamma-glutamate capsule biosynthesis protein CapA/YwtB (metallophosphatase superfamily)
MNRILSHAFVTLFLCGDIMTGRGIDQILPHSADPRLYEPYLRDARDYVELAEQVNGPIPRRVDGNYVWGDALEEFRRRGPDVKIVNLETSITAGGEPWPGKGIHYRMHPGNAPVLTAAGIDVCSLANNHVLDWGYEGLADTLKTLHKARVQTAGAGNDATGAESPAAVEIAGNGRVLVFSFGVSSSGIPCDWAASAGRPGVNLLPELSEEVAGQISAMAREVKRPGDLVVASVHWGGNWGYGISAVHRRFAHLLIDGAGVDLVHGHSSHHPKGIEVYREKLVLYGCGDLVTDYEGIGGYEAFRSELGLMYFVRIDTKTGKLAGLEMVPMRMRRFRLVRTTWRDAAWLRDTLNREGERFGTRVEMKKDGVLVLRWENG